MINMLSWQLVPNSDVNVNEFFWTTLVDNSSNIVIKISAGLYQKFETLSKEL